MAGQKRKKKKTKIKIKPVPVLILFAVVVVSTLGIVFALGAKSDSKTSAVATDANKTGTGTGSQNNSVSTATTTVSIDMDGCAIPIGTSLKVTATVDSSETRKALNWTSSDQNVFTVDENGVITIKGKGMAALTATVGNASAAIVIEGIENSDSAESAYDLPIYNLIAGGSGTTGTENTGTGTTGTGTTGTGTTGTGTTGTGTTGSGTTGTGTTGAGTTGIGTTGTGNTGTGTTGTGTTGTGTTGTGTTGTGTTGTGTTGTASNSGSSNTGTEGLTSTELYASLNSIGYSQRLSNLYIYEENSVYYGEIIIESNVAIIYIKQRNEGFDAKINSVLAKLLPVEHNLVWSNYLAATSDRTFTVEGRMVRIVTAVNGGHSQIVIYN